MKSPYVLVIGSAPDAQRAALFPKQKNLKIVCTNNAWRLRSLVPEDKPWRMTSDWDYLIIADNFPLERRPMSISICQEVRGSDHYRQAANDFGGMVFCGATMAFSATYWALFNLKPRFLGIIGCDMDYSQSDGITHFYGKGEPDPLRDNFTLMDLEAKSSRLMLLAQRCGCFCLNLSNKEVSRLTFPRVSDSKFFCLNIFDQLRLRLGLESHHDFHKVRKIIRQALKLERAAEFDKYAKQYWKEKKNIDMSLIKSVDSLWREAGDEYNRIFALRRHF